jgi:hypothetical protein
MRRNHEMLQHAQVARARVVQEAQQRAEAERLAQIPAQRSALQRKIQAFSDDFDGEYGRLGRYVLASDGGELRPEEWDMVDDHRYVTLAWKAMQYDLATRKQAPMVRRKLAGTKRVVRPGSQRDPGDTHAAEQSAAMANLKANPESRDAQYQAFLALEKARTRARSSRGRRT